MFSVCALLYGEHHELARRVLDSIANSLPPPEVVADLRIGLNAVCRGTREYVFDYAARRMLDFPVYVYEPPRNVGKYPLMRRMFYDPRRPLATEVMWFDDDSFIEPGIRQGWWNCVASHFDSATQVGHIHTIRQRGNQYLAIREQPWYTGQLVGPGYQFTFATGGWWAAKSDFLTRWNYPFPELYHNGGDSILGELIRQQRQQLVMFKDGVQINVGGRQARRGIGVAGEVYIWQNHEPGKQVDLSHHAFECRVHAFASCDMKSAGST